MKHLTKRTLSLFLACVLLFSTTVFASETDIDASGNDTTVTISGTDAGLCDSDETGTDKNGSDSEPSGFVDVGESENPVTENGGGIGDNESGPDEIHFEVQDGKLADDGEYPASTATPGITMTRAAPNVSANDQAELQAALDDTSVSAIVINGDIELTDALTVPPDRAVKLVSGNGGTVCIYATVTDTRHFSLYDTGSVDLEFDSVILDGDSKGGGISYDNTSLTMTGATIQNCVASSSYGGGIFGNSCSSYLTAVDCAIIGNRTAIHGGGIYSYGDISVTGCKINNNTSAGYGGGIYSEGNVTVKNSSVDGNNAAGANGGGIYCSNDGSLLSIENSTVNNNTSGGGGGGIYTSASAVIIGSEINGNTTSSYGNGGGINGSGYAPDVSLSIENSMVNRNTAGANGGGILWSTGGDVTITGCEVNDNISLNSGLGGGVYCSDGFAAMTDSSFCGNKMPAYSTGGGIQCYSAVIDNCVINNNETGMGGGIHCTGPSNILNCDIIGNIAANSPAGGIFDNNNELTPTVVEGCDIGNNTATIGGGIFGSGKTIVIGCAIIGNTARDYQGGGVYNVDTVTGSTINGNTALYGGGIMSANSVTDCTISENTAAGGSGGGGTFSVKSISNCIISDNKALALEGATFSGYGGGIFSSDIITGCTVKNNVADNDGGGIYGGNTTVANCVISGNISGRNGGGVFAGPVNKLQITGPVTFFGNKAGLAYWLEMESDHTYDGKTADELKGLYDGGYKQFIISLSAPPDNHAPFGYMYNNYDVGYVGSEEAAAGPEVLLFTTDTDISGLKYSGVMGWNPQIIGLSEEKPLIRVRNTTGTAWDLKVIYGGFATDGEIEPDLRLARHDGNGGYVPIGYNEPARVYDAAGQQDDEYVEIGWLENGCDMLRVIIPGARFDMNSKKYSAAVCWILENTP